MFVQEAFFLAVTGSEEDIFPLWLGFYSVLNLRKSVFRQKKKAQF